MKLYAAGKKKLLASAQEVYLGYAALDFFKSRTFITDSGQKSIFELCQKALSEKKYNQTLFINGIHYQLNLIPGKDNTVQVQFSRPLGGKESAEVKKINSYTDQDVLNLLSSQHFNFELSKESDELAVSNKIKKGYVIGGLGKIDLYRTHLVTLHNIIDKIDKEEDISNLLVALATGTGKTYVQALWMLILTLSDNNGVFTVPDKLAHQFAKDLKRLLPDSFVDSMFILREQENNPEAEDALKSLVHKKTAGTIIIGSSEYLLDKHYHDLENANSQHTFLAFDEQHLIMKAERRRIRLIELSKKKLSMFLTATPNLETYELSGNKPVAIMSSGQKMEAGQGQFPKLVSFEARNITDRNKLKTFRFWTREFWENMFNGLLLRLTNAIQEEHSSAAVSLVDDLLYYHFDKEGETSARWRMQVPAARKMLCIIDDNETLVNFCNALEHRSYYRRDVYRDGNLVNRADVANFFNIPDAEEDVIENDLRHKREEYQASLKSDEFEVSINGYDQSLAKQVKYTLFHNLIEYVLTDLTGLDEIEHNRIRKQSANDFQNLILSRFVPRSAEYYQEKLSKEIDSEGARELGEILAELSSVLQQMVNKEFNSSEADNALDLRNFIDNWPLYNALIDKIKEKSWDFTSKFEKYAQSHLIMGVMSGMKDAETPVAESQPFSGLNRTVHRLYDNNGLLESDAKKRKHTSLEILNDTSTETVFTPSYLNISEEIADNYFRLGFVGIYVSNKKTEGFSDRNLHTVINIAEETLSATNSPDTQIQGIGRNRGLDSTIVPAYIHSLGRKQKTVFDLDNLQSNDYYPALFKSQKEYNNQYIKVLGAKVSQQIIAWIYKHMDDDETINPDHLKRHVLKYIALALRDINNKNSHQIKLSRAQLTDVVRYAMQDIDKELAHIKKPYRLSFFLQALSHTLNFLSECYYTVKRIPVASKIFFYSWFGKRDLAQGAEGQKHPDDVYIKILNKTNFKDIIGNMSTALEFRNWMGRKVQGVQSHINKNIANYLKSEVTEEYATHQKSLLEPMLMNLVVDSQKDKVAKALASFPESISFLHAHLPLLSSVFSNNTDRFEETVLTFMQQIPGLSDLELTDIVNYPKKIADILALFDNEPINILIANPKLQKSYIDRLAAFLHKDFTKHLSSFVSYPDAVKVEKLLANEKNARLFANHCTRKLLKGEFNFSPDFIFSELKTFFKLKKFTPLNEEIRTMWGNFNLLEDEIRANVIQSLDDETTEQLVLVVKDQLLPLLVNAYPLKYRKYLLAEAADKVKIKSFLIEHSNELHSLVEQDGIELADSFFSNLIKDTLPEAINPVLEIKAAEEFIKNKLDEIMRAGYKQLMVGKLLAPSTWSLTPEYIYDTAIADLLQSDQFLDAISLMLPYDQWLKLKTDMRQNYPALIKTARVFIDKATQGATQPSPEELLDILNKNLNTHYVGSVEAAKNIQNNLERVIKDIQENFLQKLSPSLKNQLVQIGEQQLLPVLASFIKDDAKKKEFLGIKRDPKVIFDFIIQNQSSLINLMDGREGTIKLNALGLINQLMPDNKKLVIKGIQNPETRALSSLDSLQKDLKKTFIITFLASDEFHDVLSVSFNSHDVELIMRALRSEEPLKLLAKKMVDQEIDNLDKDTLLRIIKSSIPELEHIETIEVRLQSFQNFLSEIANNIGSNLDKNKSSELITKTMIPILFHKKFIETIDKLTGFLDEKDLTVIFDAFHRVNPALEAKQYMRFISLIRDRNVEALTKEFMSLSEDEADFDFDQLPAKKMLDTIKDLIEEVLDCHCYYNEQDRKGSVGTSERPKLESRISSQLAGMTISSNYSFLEGFTRKGFYIHGITKGLDAGGEISADSKEHVVKVLERVKSHILRPFWWSANVSQFTHSFIKGCRDLTHDIVYGWYGFVNGYKSVLNYISNSDYFTVSSKNPDSGDFNDTAFDFASKVNTLDPLSADHVKDKDCPVDVVIHMEDFVVKRPARPGFFGGNLGTPMSVSDEQASSSVRFDI